MELEYLNLQDLIQKNQIKNINEIKKLFDSLCLYVTTKDKKMHKESNLEAAFFIHFIFFLLYSNSKIEGDIKKISSLNIDLISQKILIKNKKEINAMLLKMLIQNNSNRKVKIDLRKKQVLISFPFDSIVSECDMRRLNTLNNSNNYLFLLKLKINKKVPTFWIKNLFLLWSCF
jgi:hypothetical protein